MNQDEVKQKELIVDNIVTAESLIFPDRPRTLSPREKQIFFLWAGGLDRSEICQALRISRENLKKHLQSINKKIPPVR